MTWVEKYRPKTFKEIRGQGIALEKVQEFVRNFKFGKKAIVLYGPPGTGKTTIAHVVAGETGAEIFELNASDLRDRARLEAVLKPAIEQQSLIKKWKIILIDEVDGISALDRGGLSELLYLIEKTQYPVIITANDIWDRKLAELRKASELVQLKEIDYNTIKEILIDILRNEKKFIDISILTNVALKARGDIRAAINDLQTIAHANKKDLEEVEIDERNKEIDIFKALRSIFKEKPKTEMLSLFDSVNLSLDDILLWIEENIPAEYQKEELAKAYDAVSKADVFRGRIYKQQYWRFLVYQNIFLSYAISAAKKEKKAGFTSYKKPTRILKIWMNNQKTASKKTIAQKFARFTHIGEKRAMHDFPIIRNFVKSPETIKELKLTEKEIAYLEKED
ncbi:MAG: replication factor C large subunit [Candidatus Pacearchaeota archaeon]